MVDTALDSTYRNQTLAEAARARAERCPDQVAIYLENEPPVRYGEIYAQACALAGALQSLGLRAGEVISFQLPNWREVVAIDIAASLLGLVVNPIIPIYRERELEFILRDADSRLIFIPERYRNFDFAEMLQRLRAQLPALQHIVLVRGAASRPGTQSFEQLLVAGSGAALAPAAGSANALKTLMYTSGTTGRAKAVMHSQNTLARALDNSAGAWGIGADDVMLMPSPVTHITGFVNGIELPFFTDAKSALMERWDVELALAYIPRVRASLCVSATPFLQELVQTAERRGIDLPSLRLFACGGAAVDPGLIRKAHQVLPHCRACRVYGSTEAPLVTVGYQGAHEGARAAQTDGRPHNWSVRIVDDAGTVLPSGADGEILVRGPAMMLGYRDAAQTVEALTADGYFHTGDIGHLTAEGALVITDRKKDIIIRGGENLSAKEIEDVLHTHPQIREAAVVSMPHARLGETVCAYVILQPDTAAATVTAESLRPLFEASGLARQKWPEAVQHCADFPRTASGKIRKDVLRQRIREQLSGQQRTQV